MHFSIYFSFKARRFGEQELGSRFYLHRNNHSDTSGRHLPQRCPQGSLNIPPSDPPGKRAPSGPDGLRLLESPLFSCRFFIFWWERGYMRLGVDVFGLVTACVAFLLALPLSTHLLVSDCHFTLFSATRCTAWCLHPESRPESPSQLGRGCLGGAGSHSGGTGVAFAASWSHCFPRPLPVSTPRRGP